MILWRRSANDGSRLVVEADEPREAREAATKWEMGLPVDRKVWAWKAAVPSRLAYAVAGERDPFGSDVNETYPTDDFIELYDVEIGLL